MTPQTNSQTTYRNEPANLPLILKGIANLRSVASETLAQQLYSNHQRLWETVL